jgi:general secretion pathway protein D
MNKLLLTLAILSCNLIHADEICTKLDQCIKKVANLTETTYLYDNKIIKDSGFSSHKFTLTKENADLYISHLLNANGYTRVPFGLKGTYKIVNNRDIRYTATPLYIVGQDKVPFHYDYIQAVLKLDHITSKDLVRTFRPFMSRYGRIMPFKAQNKVLIQDTASNIHRLISLTKHVDYPLTKQQQKEERDNKAFNRKLRLVEAKHPAVTHHKKH